MKYDFSTILLDATDKPIATSDTDVDSFTVRKACLQAVLVDDQENRASKESRYGLFVAIKSAKDADIELTLDEVQLLKKQVLLAYPTIIAGQICMVLEQKTAGVKTSEGQVQ